MSKQIRDKMIAENSVFYRNGFRLLLIFVFVAIAIAYLLLGFIIYQQINRPETKYFATTSSGQLIEIKPNL